MLPEAPIALDVEPEDPEALAQVVSLLVAGSARPQETAPALPPTPEPALAVLSRGLTGLDLAPRIRDDGAVDGDQTLGDQAVRLAPRADARLTKPFVQTNGFVAVIGARKSHGPA